MGTNYYWRYTLNCGKVKRERDCLTDHIGKHSGDTFTFYSIKQYNEKANRLCQIADYHVWIEDEYGKLYSTPEFNETILNCRFKELHRDFS